MTGHTSDVKRGARRRPFFLATDQPDKGARGTPGRRAMPVHDINLRNVFRLAMATLTKCQDDRLAQTLPKLGSLMTPRESGSAGGSVLPFSMAPTSYSRSGSRNLTI